MLAAAACLAQTNTLETPLAPAPYLQPRYLPGTCSGEPLTRLLWVSPTQFIPLPQQISYGPHTTTLSLKNLTTGTQTPLTSMETLIREAGEITASGKIAIADGHLQGILFSPYSTFLSPDGRWLLWRTRIQGQPTWETMTLQGTQRRQWPRATGDDNTDGGVGWMQDSAHFVEISQEPGNSGEWKMRARVFSMDTPTVQEFPLVPPHSGFLLPPFPSSEVLFTGDGRGWVMGWGSEQYEIIPGPQTWSLRPARLLTAAAPTEGDGSTASDCSLSPSGRWVVWNDYTSGQTSNGTTWRTRINISRPDGSEAQTIFESSVRPACGLLFGPHWTPDEQNIVIHWHGSSPIANAPNGEGLYLISLAQNSVSLPRPASLPAGSKVARGAFPTAWNHNPGTQLAGNISH